ncbi:NAD binding domain of 6-phosphogluconate dehydrogenase-domain-containing protein [Aspergillus floccosus]
MAAAKQKQLAQNWAFIGLGNMGGPMALNLRRLSDVGSLLIYDTNTRAAEDVVAKAEGNIAVALDLDVIARRADVIIACLPNPQVVEQVFTELLAHGKDVPRDRLIIDCSTIDPITSRRIASSMGTVGFGEYVDAPMSGGVVGARAGTLSFMVGSSTPQIFDSVVPILRHMGRRVVHCGPRGTGLSAKLANNYLLAINNLATAEAMNFGIKAGLGASTLAEIINSATGRSWASEVNNPVPGVAAAAPASRCYQGGFATALMNKDLKLAIAAAEQAQAPLLLAPVVSSVYGALAGDAGYSKLDFSVVYKALSREWDPKANL